MVEQDRYCADILTQISSVHEALRGVARELMRNHLKHCAASAIREGAERADEDMRRADRVDAQTQSLIR